MSFARIGDIDAVVCVFCPSIAFCCLARGECKNRWSLIIWTPVEGMELALCPDDWPILKRIHYSSRPSHAWRVMSFARIGDIDAVVCVFCPSIAFCCLARGPMQESFCVCYRLRLLGESDNELPPTLERTGELEMGLFGQSGAVIRPVGSMRVPSASRYIGFREVGRWAISRTQVEN